MNKVVMKKLIDKTAVVAEIEKRLHANGAFNEVSDEAWAEDVGMCNAYKSILSFLDTLEVKEVDLGQEIKNGIDNLSNLYCYMEDLFNGNEEEGVYPIPENVKNELFEFAKHFFELELKAQKGKSFIGTLETKEEDKEVNTKNIPKRG